MIVGYARTLDLGANRRIRGSGTRSQGGRCRARVLRASVHSVAARAQLEAALDFIRAGDVFVVTTIDRLARSVADLCALVKRIEAKEATVLRDSGEVGLDTSTRTGKLMLNMLGSVAQFEREMMLERQREGIAKAAAEGKFTRAGLRRRAPRPPTSTGSPPRGSTR